MHYQIGTSLFRSVYHISVSNYQNTYYNYLLMNIYVGNLSRQAGEVALRALFAAYGEVKSVKIIKDMESGEARGFAFVEMTDDNAAKEAIAGLDSQEFENRRLKVNEARPKNTSGSRYNSFSSNYGYKDRNNTY